jgi:hypothetical protein
MSSWPRDPISAASHPRRPPSNCGGLDAQREVLARRDQLLRQQETARQKQGEAEAGKRRAEAARESVRVEVDGETYEEIPARIAAAADRAQAEASLQHCERKLAEIGDGRTIAALDTEVAAIAAETCSIRNSPGCSSNPSA